MESRRFSVLRMVEGEYAMNVDLKISLEEMLKEIGSQREEILRAFIAKHGFEPDRAIQIERRMPDGTSTWYVRRLTDEEMASQSLAGASL